MHLPLYRQTDIFAGCGWNPSRSTLQNILEQVDFAILGLFSFMAKAVQGDGAVGIDESSCRMIMPQEMPQARPGDLKTQRLIEKIKEAKSKGEQGMSVAARTEHRQKYSVPILVAIKNYIDTLDDQVVLPKSDVGEAIGYVRNHWEALCVYASDGRIPIDNNRVEQLMREVALGRKNWLFVGNVPAGERSARLMTVVSSVKRHHLDVWKYLKDVLDRLLAGETDYAKLVPDAWKREHPEAVRVYREQESRYKSDRKQLDRARRVIAARQKRQAN